ncbi:putative Late nodulin [Medicago truncatula]|uniref:Putative Late nodulin n=1 Tax=Medicago truncatula TaxID=3880 RepID=A0A396GHZ8_MEDTR|nr:putative Late nodulin [Medicago truncatula]
MMRFINYKAIKGKNMAQFSKLFYVIIIFLSLFLVAMSADHQFECTTDHDCREVECFLDTLVAKCFVSFVLGRFLSKGICSCV